MARLGWLLFTGYFGLAGVITIVSTLVAAAWFFFLCQAAFIGATEVTWIFLPSLSRLPEDPALSFILGFLHAAAYPVAAILVFHLIMFLLRKTLRASWRLVRTFVPYLL